MGKKQAKREECKAGLPMWMASYSDLVTLLLTFFVLLQSMSTFDDVQKVEAVMESVHLAFGDAGRAHGMRGEGDTTDRPMPAQQPITVNPLSAKLRDGMSEHISDDMIKQTHNEEELRVRLDDKILFKTGGTELHPAAYAMIADISEVVLEHDLSLRVEGHTDAEGSEHDNWVLSQARALAVVEFMRERGVPGQHLEASGFAHFRPASDIGESDQWNRRIELVIHGDNYKAAKAVEGLMKKPINH